MELHFLCEISVSSETWGKSSVFYLSALPFSFSPHVCLFLLYSPLMWLLFPLKWPLLFKVTRASFLFEISVPHIYLFFSLIFVTWFVRILCDVDSALHSLSTDKGRKGGFGCWDCWRESQIKRDEGRGEGELEHQREIVREESQSIRVSWRCTFSFFLFCHDSLFNLLSSSSTSSPPSFPFSITGHLHLLIELFCHWSVHRLALWSILHLSTTDRLLIDERAGQIKQLGQVAEKETERHVFFR